jgi:quercetin dioxygenase-like cupin family protein
MPLHMKPIRRVVTGNDAQGRSGVLFDSTAPNVNVGTIAASAGMTDVWAFSECPAPIIGQRDDGNLPFSFDPPANGGHLRIVHSAGKPDHYDPAQDSTAVPVHAPVMRANGHTMDRGGQNAFSSPIHRSQTLDYGVLLEGLRTLILDDGERVLQPGDIVVQLSNWHGWTNPDAPSLMAFIMMGAKAIDPAGSK